MTDNIDSARIDIVLTVNCGALNLIIDSFNDDTRASEVMRGRYSCKKQELLNVVLTVKVIREEYLTISLLV